MNTLPQEWSDRVVSILETKNPGTYSITQTARLDWLTLFPDAFSFEMLGVLATILRLGAITDFRKVETMLEQGETYEFLFIYQGNRMYSKINLCDGKVKVIVYSAHLQRLGNIKEGKFV